MAFDWNYVIYAVLGGLFGWFMSYIFVLYSKAKDKKTLIKRMLNQKQQIFYTQKEGTDDKEQVKSTVLRDLIPQEVLIEYNNEQLKDRSILTKLKNFKLKNVFSK